MDRILLQTFDLEVLENCISDVTRAPCLQGIYRVNGVKTRVEKLCQAFENGKELVELSQASPHDISNVLKLYLRQVNLNNTRMLIAKTSPVRFVD